MAVVCEDGTPGGGISGDTVEDSEVKEPAIRHERRACVLTILTFKWISYKEISSKVHILDNSCKFWMFF